MKVQTLSLWGEERQTLEQAMALTVQSLQKRTSSYKHWVIAFSGGKDSTTVATFVMHLIETGQIPAPEKLTVVLADTGMEAPPLLFAALETLKTLASRGVQTQIVRPDLDERFFVYMFGRGVPPPKNGFRWCTRLLKVKPMDLALAGVREASGEKMILLTGVREGESAMRDKRLTIACSKDGAECGQGYFQLNPPDAVDDTLAPILHWRVCHVWDWLTFFAPQYGFRTSIVAEIYGGDEAQETNARTGCVGCNLVSEDKMLVRLVALPDYAYLAPLQRLRPLYAELLKPQNRLRKDGSQRRRDGSLPKKHHPIGPLTMGARRYGLAQVKAIQEDINREGVRSGRPMVSLISSEEENRILELIEANTWPEGWTGEEPRGGLNIPLVLTKDLSVLQNQLLA
ncbi:MAG: phosphoadenosine phosphosulfate reductase family protein [Ktedonobacteraceae bacterium]|nr:phosphoadenosine phosphosulfate reductase family protein [Ktedonobacteraceae bacterium]